MEINDKLNNKFLSQCFPADKQGDGFIEKYKMMAESYAAVENAVAVLSDLQEEVSYIYYGGIASILGLGEKGTSKTIDSIWEKEVFEAIETSSLDKRNLDELQFFHFMKSIPKSERADYYLISCIKMKTLKGLLPINHRIFYVDNQDDNSVRLALCLYNIASVYLSESYICNTLNGSRMVIDRHNLSNILSEREKEILHLIEQGKLSKEIADCLSISIHTVSRHRQNILDKLRAQNSFEACKTARLLNLL